MYLLERDDGVEELQRQLAASQLQIDLLKRAVDLAAHTAVDSQEAARRAAQDALAHRPSPLGGALGSVQGAPLRAAMSDPQTLRQLFVMKELLDPPVSMREQGTADL